jgi:diaminopimelate epimerase
MKIQFYKYQGTGNDFVIIDNRETGNGHLSTAEIRHLCDRRFGIGADGLMMLNELAGFDFSMKYYNADGGEGSMCGNGGRCMVKFAYDLGIHKSAYRFMAIDGVHEAELDLNGLVRLKMQDVPSFDMQGDSYILNTGSPHFVKFLSDGIDEYDVTEEGREIRNSKKFKKDGINVNFVQVIDDHTIFVRTYERAVEAETFSCGTGVTAAALMAAHNETGFNQVDVRTLGGKLSVEFDRWDENSYTNIWLIGPAEFVFRGEIELKD